MTPSDIPAGLALCRAAGWNQRSAEWELFLAASPGRCSVALASDRRVVGTVTTLSFQDHFGWVGMLLVDPSSRKKGIGTLLLKESLQVLSHQQTVKLDATPEGREVYRKLDFVDEYPLIRLLAKNVRGTRNKPSNVTMIGPEDIDRVNELDQNVFGADRKIMLDWIWQQAPSLAFMAYEGEQIHGYCFGRPGYNFTHIGPVVSSSATGALALVHAALSFCQGDVILDVPLHSTVWLDGLAALGFTEQRRLIRMYRGTNLWPGLPGHRFAIMGPEYG
jgi:GNAT superfamily N-acetyltransferase